MVLSDLRIQIEIPWDSTGGNDTFSRFPPTNRKRRFITGGASSSRKWIFVISERGGGVTAIECKWSARNWRSRNLRAFRELYPKGKNLVVVGQTGEDLARRVDGLDLEICSLQDLPARLGS